MSATTANWMPWPQHSPQAGARQWVTVQTPCDRWVSVAIPYRERDGVVWREAQDGRIVSTVTHFAPMQYPEAPPS